jgi:hypothetical protein
MFVANLVTNYFANTQGPFQKAAQAEQGQGAARMEIDDNPVLTTLQKKSKVAEGVFCFLETMSKFAPSMQATPEEITMLNQWRTRTVAEALGINPTPQQKPAVVPQPNVDEDEDMDMDMDMEDDSNEEESAGAPPSQPSGAAPPRQRQQRYDHSGKVAGREQHHCLGEGGHTHWQHGCCYPQENLSHT